MTILDWRDATRNDVASLHMFTCAPPKPRGRLVSKLKQDRWWERDVQSNVRDLRLPVPPSTRLLLGFDHAGLLSAVSHWEELDGPSAVELLWMAVGNHMRGAGGAAADEMFDQTLIAIVDRIVQQGIPYSRVLAMVWHQNTASQRMCHRAGLRRSPEDDGADGVQAWVVELQPEFDEPLDGPRAGSAISRV